MRLVIILLILITYSCDVQKEAVKRKEDRTLTESTEVKTVRIGDTVRYEVPKLVLKDTTIYTRNVQGTTLRTVYNDKGNIETIECLSSQIEEIRKTNRTLIEAIKEKDREKTEKFDSTIFLWGGLGLAVLIILLLLYNKYFGTRL